MKLLIVYVIVFLLSQVFVSYFAASIILTVLLGG